MESFHGQALITTPNPSTDIVVSVLEQPANVGKSGWKNLKSGWKNLESHLKKSGISKNLKSQKIWNLEKSGIWNLKKSQISNLKSQISACVGRISKRRSGRGGGAAAAAAAARAARKNENRDLRFEIF